MTTAKPFFIIVPGASQNPAHYGLLCHTLMEAGFPVFTGLLPSIGGADAVTAKDDADYVRRKLILPVLDYEERDAILVMHSYSSIPGSAAAAGLSKTERTRDGCKTGLIGQIFLSSLLVKGDAEATVLGAFGGHYPPHLRPDESAGLIRCDDRINPLYQDIAPPTLRDAVAISAMAQSLTSFNSSIPRATWDSEHYKDRVAFVRTHNDNAVPLHIQQMMIDGSGAQWLIEDIASSHSAQISMPRQLSDIFIKLAKRFEDL